MIEERSLGSTRIEPVEGGYVLVTTTATGAGHSFGPYPTAATALKAEMHLRSALAMSCHYFGEATRHAVHAGAFGEPLFRPDHSWSAYREGAERILREIEAGRLDRAVLAQTLHLLGYPAMAPVDRLAHFLKAVEHALQREEIVQTRSRST